MTSRTARCSRGVHVAVELPTPLVDDGPPKFFAVTRAVLTRASTTIWPSTKEGQVRTDTDPPAALHIDQPLHPPQPAGVPAAAGHAVVRREIERLRRGGRPRVLDLFAGCGGLSLGFHAAGFAIVAAVEK